MYLKSPTYVNDINHIVSPEFEIFKNKNFLITGASGLVGSCLIDTLLLLNDKYSLNLNVYALFRNNESFITRFPSYENNKFLHKIIGDIYEIELTSLDLSLDYIIHTASNTHPKLYAENPVETMVLNFDGTRKILDLAKQNLGSKLLFLSTLEVYGEDSDVNKFKEDDYGYINILSPRSAYPESKRACETLCIAYSKEFNINSVIARLGYIYGPTVKLTSSKADVQFLNNALNHENIVMKSKGDQTRSYCYVVDVVSALLTLLLKGQNSEAYNIANKNSNVTLKDFAQNLADISGVKLTFENPSEIEKLGYSTVKNSMLDATKLENLGWSAKFSLKEGITNTLKIKKELQC